MLLRSALSLLFLLAVVRSQSLPPAKYDGFVYTKGRVDPDPVAIEAFLDPLCPYSRDSWPSLKKTVAHYGRRVWLIVHLLPLPYHDNAYAASRALHIVNKLNSSGTFPLLELFFKHQERFYGAQTINKTRASVIKDIQRLASKVADCSGVEAGFNDRQTDLRTRVSFKYSASRGVYGTPTFFLNGFLVPDNGSTIDYNGWRHLIDPLLSSREA
ncbi:hypothetical protein CDL15_Pgr021299 [Punica granatum]|nr:hypothetical protein CDL15_Pgr021299 [Punica granatum]